MNHNQTLCASVQAKIYEQIERTEHLSALLPQGQADWVPPISGAWSLGILLGHLLDCLAGFCAVLYAAAPTLLASLIALRSLAVNHHCSPAEAASRIAAYRAGLDEGFAAILDSDLSGQLPTLFVKTGELLLTLLRGLRRSREFTRVCLGEFTRQPAFGGDDNAFPTIGLRLHAQRSQVVTLIKHKVAILGERRGRVAIWST